MAAKVLTTKQGEEVKAAIKKYIADNKLERYGDTFVRKGVRATTVKFHSYFMPDDLEAIRKLLKKIPGVLDAIEDVPPERYPQSWGMSYQVTN